MNLSDTFSPACACALLTATVLAVVPALVRTLTGRPAPQRMTSHRIGRMLTSGFLAAVVEMFVGMLTDTDWMLLGGGLLFAVALFVLWPLDTICREQELRAARRRDRELGLPVARDLLHPGLVAIPLTGVGLLTGWALTIAGASSTYRGPEATVTIGTEHITLSSLILLAGAWIIAAALLTGVGAWLVQAHRRKRENRRVVRDRAAYDRAHQW